MNIFVNNMLNQAEPDQTIASLLVQLGFDKTQYVAIAVNEIVINKKMWPSYQLQVNDRLLLISPINGG